MADDAEKKVVVKITADTSSVDEQLEKADKKLDEVTESAKKAGDAVTRFGSGLSSSLRGLGDIGKNLGAGVFNHFRTEIELTRDYYRGLSDDLGKSTTPSVQGTNTRSAVSGMREVSETAREAAESLSDVYEEAEDAGDSVYTIGQRLSDGLRGVLGVGQSLGAGVFDHFRNEIELTREYYRSLREEADEFDEDVDTQKVQKEIDKAESKLAGLEARMEKMRFLGVDEGSRQFQSLQYDIDTVKESLAGLNTSLAAGLEKDITGIGDRMRELAGTEVPTEDYNDLSAKIAKAEASLFRLYNRQEKMKDTGVKENSRQWQSLQYDIGNAEEALARYEREMEALKSGGGAFLSGASTAEYADLTESLAQSQAALEQARSDAEAYLQDIEGESVGLFSRIISGGSSAFRTLTSGIASAGVSAAKYLGPALAKGFQTSAKWAGTLAKNITGIGSSAKKNKSFIDQMTKSLTSFFTIMRSRLKRQIASALFSDLQSDFGAMATVSDRFNRSVSSMIDSSRVLGAQLIAAAEPIVSVVFPILSSLADRVTATADTLAQFAARVTGNDTYLKATKGQSDYAASLDSTANKTKSATKATKEFQGVVLGFDQLNKLPGATSGIGLDSASLDQAQTDATKLNRIADDIFSAFKAGDFTGAGASIAAAVNEAFGWLDGVAGWTQNGERFTSFLNGFVGTVNGFVDGLDASYIGFTIADVANTLINGLALLTDPDAGIDFDKAGERIGELLISAVSNTSWDKLGQGLVQSVQGGVKVINGVLSKTIIDETTGETTTVASSLGRAFSDLFSGAIGAIEPEEWGGLISNIVNSFSDFINEAFGDTSNADELGTKIGATINNAVAGIDENALAGAVSAVAQNVVALFGAVFEEVKWGDVWDKLVSVVSSEEFDWEAILTAAGILSAAGLLANMITGGLSGSITSAILAGLAGASYGVNALIEGVPGAVEKTKSIFTGKDSLGALGDIDADFGFGGKLGAAMSSKLSGEAITDTTGEWVAFKGVIMTAQEYFDLVNQGVFTLEGSTYMASDSMLEVANSLLEQGTAVDTATASVDSFSTSMTNAGVAVSEASAKMGTASDDLLKKVSSSSLGLFSSAASVLGGLVGTKRASIPGFASGGIVSDGQLFVANEGGRAELIGDDGRGSTAIVNNTQIINAVVEGVARAVSPISRQVDAVLRAIQAGGGERTGDIVLMANNRELARSVEDGQRQLDKQFNTVSFA